MCPDGAVSIRPVSCEQTHYGDFTHAASTRDAILKDMEPTTWPETFQQEIRYFTGPDVCLAAAVTI
jgi:hypothetical protein